MLRFILTLAGASIHFNWTATTSVAASSKLARLSTVTRVLVNQLGNAIKFTPSGGTVAIAVHPADAGNTIVFSI
jgi:signal transduction histidine kinase